MDVLEAEARAGKTVVATTHDLLCAAQRFHQAALLNRRLVAHGPAALVLDQALLSATYGGHVLVLPGEAGAAVVIDDAHHHDQAPGGERHYHDGGLMDVLDLLGDPMSLRLHAARPGRGARRRRRLRRDGHLRRPQGPGLHRRRGQPCRLSGARRRIHARLRRCTSAAPSPQWRPRWPSAGSRGGASSDSTPRSASSSRARSPSASSSSARSTTTSATCSATSSATSWRSPSRTSSRSSVLGAIVLAVVVVLRKELLFATFDPLGAAASGLPVAALEYAAPGAPRGDDRRQHPGRRASSWSWRCS